MKKEFVLQHIEEKDGKKDIAKAYKLTTFDEIVDHLEKYGTKEEKAEFKANCYKKVKKKPTGRTDKNGKPILEDVKDDDGNVIMEESERFNWLYAKRRFFETYVHEYNPPKKVSGKAARISAW